MAGTLAADFFKTGGGIVRPVPVQIQRLITGTVATGTTTIPADNTIPQITEGDQYMSLAITPTSATSLLDIDVTWFGSNNAGALITLTAALFQDATANALAAGFAACNSAGATLGIRFRHIMVAGTTLATTFRVRAGCGTGATTTTFNGTAGAQLMGGVLASSIIITELSQ